MEDQPVTSPQPISPPPTQTPSPTQDSTSSQTPPISLDNPNKRKFKIILIGFFVLFFLTIGAAAAIYTFKEISRNQKNDTQKLPSTNPKPSIENTISPVPITSSIANECVVSGCSGQFCINKTEADGFVSTCEYSEQYACYKTAECKIQSDGNCGWTQTSQLSSCIESAQ